MPGSPLAPADFATLHSYLAIKLTLEPNFEKLECACSFGKSRDHALQAGLDSSIFEVSKTVGRDCCNRDL